MNPTKEQQAIIDTYVAGESCLVQAGPGVGKTFSICLAANTLQRNGLYLAFNKAIAKEVEGKLPSYIESRTTHSLAYASIGHRYQNKLSRPKGRYVNVAATPSEIVRYFSVKGFMDVNDLEVAKLTKLTVNRFESSADHSLNDNHIPKGGMIEIIKRAEKRRESASQTDMAGLKGHVMKYATLLWEGRKDISSDVLATHDTYLKLFQLSKPDLGVEVVFLDECQDITPCVYDIVKQQEGRSQIIAVGDASQAIYQWRGAINAMEMFPYKKLPLSQSFRFGQEVADVANMIISGSSEMDIKGNPNNDGKVGEIDVEELASSGQEVCLISRTNMGVLMNALSFIDQGIPVDIKINVNDFCRILSEAQYLYDGETRKVKHEDLVGFQNWSELMEEAKEDAGLKRIATIVMQGKTYSITRQLKNNDSKNANIICITAHKSKGLEWDNVVLDEDFLPLDKEGLPVMERNLLYVAATRAMRTLALNDDLNKHYHTNGVS